MIEVMRRQAYPGSELTFEQTLEVETADLAGSVGGGNERSRIFISF